MELLFDGVFPATPPQSILDSNSLPSEGGSFRAPVLPHLSHGYRIISLIALASGKVRVPRLGAWHQLTSNQRALTPRF